MFSRIRRRITFANVAMTLALVFVMSGGAYAAGKYLINSTKQINPKVLKALKGKTGAAGKEGLAGKEGAAGKEGPKGANGTNGTEGPKGANGTNGSNGESVTASAFSGKVGTCKEGGSEFTIGTSPPTFACNGIQGIQGVKGSNGTNGTNGESVTTATEPKGANCEEGGAKFKVGATTTYACNGSPWTDGGTLPSGQSETGAWGTTIKGPGPGFSPISFTIPLKTPPVGAYFLEGTTNSHCEGTLAAPTAEAGYLCVYAGENVLAVFSSIWVPGTHTNGAGTTGAVVALGTGEEVAYWTGTWAVKAA